jgi:hypothetical protein
MLVSSDSPKEVIALLQSVYPGQTKVSSDFCHAPTIRKENEITEDYLLTGRKAYPVSVTQ